MGAIPFPAKRLHRSGFTMVELIVVLVLIGILGAIGAARYFNRNSFDAAFFAEQTRAMLRYAQKTAIARNTPVFVELGDNRIGLCHVAPNGNCPAASRVEFPSGRSTGEGTDTYCQSSTWYCLGRPKGVSYSYSVVMTQFSFDALGRPLAVAGEFPGLAITVGGDGQTRTVSVTPETGYVQ
ncbi:pilus assembly FimT family protein [Massilia sp. DD77]|uniref:pilus assembly FimT family protein n=1 Tax=Massilia sp. DD77 TaxID=3109349 RepID=UPI003000D3F6